MSHDHHESLSGFHPDQLLIDGCAECEHRAENVERAIANLDHKRFAAAWLRAADQLASTPPSGDRGGPRSSAEAPMLHAMWAMQIGFERLGLPLGWLPVGLSNEGAHTVVCNAMLLDGQMGDANMVAGLFAQPRKVPIR